MIYCLNSNELLLLLEYKIKDRTIDSESLSQLVDNSYNWQDEISVHTYLYCRLAERLKYTVDSNEMIDTFYNLPEEMYLIIQELNAQFIRYMLEGIRRKDMSIEEELVELQRSLRNHDYSRALRYRY